MLPSWSTTKQFFKHFLYQQGCREAPGSTWFLLEIKDDTEYCQAIKKISPNDIYLCLKNPLGFQMMHIVHQKSYQKSTTATRPFYCLPSRARKNTNSNLTLKSVCQGQEYQLQASNINFMPSIWQPWSVDQKEFNSSCSN